MTVTELQTEITRLQAEISTISGIYQLVGIGYCPQTMHTHPPVLDKYIAAIEARKVEIARLQEQLRLLKIDEIDAIIAS
jgi:uncharacterized small protein (DUF1192 family)